MTAEPAGLTAAPAGLTAAPGLRGAQSSGGTSGRDLAQPGKRPLGTASGAAPPGAIRQLAAILRLRAAGLRGRRRAVTWLAIAALPLIGVLSVAAGARLPADGASNALLLTPTALLGFTLTSVVAAASTGSRTLLPRNQTVIFPVSPLAEHLGTLLLTPLNAAWVLQTIALLTLSGWAFSPSGLLLPGVGMTVLWVLAGSTLAQLLGWTMELARTTAAGPWLARAATLGLVITAAGLAIAGELGAVLDRSPTVWFVAAATHAPEATGTFFFRGALLLLVTAISVVAGAALVAVLQRRTPRDQVRIEARRYAPRPAPDGALALAIRIDRASVWRSAPLRRGLVTLAAIPGGAAALAGLDWHLVVLLPGLAASGAGLLFGVNALSLDGPGAVWRESLPGNPRTLLIARLIVVTEVCLLAGAEAAAIGIVRAPGPPSAADIVSLLGAMIACTAMVVGRCARWSISYPYATTLRDARDHPAPPAAMAGYSARLALTTTFTGLAFSICARWDLVVPAVLLAVVAGCLCARSIARALRRWDDPLQRGRVIAAVSG